MTLAEYLVDYAAPATQKQGFDVIEKKLDKIPNETVKEIAINNIKAIENSDRRDFRF